MFTESFVISCLIIFTFLSDRDRHREVFGRCNYYVVITRFYTNVENIFSSCVPNCFSFTFLAMAYTEFPING